MGEKDAAIDESEKNEATDLEVKIIRQIEYYFGNYNLGKDKFLREQMKEDDGWISLETMTKFKRLKSLSDDFSVIVGALKKSPAQLMEVNEDGTRIRRRLEKPLPQNTESRKEEIDGRSIYVKGFKNDTTLDELLDFFKPHKVENITMRRRPNKVFKGSVFITFETKDDADVFFAIKDVKYGATELLKEYKKDYCKRKDIFYEQAKKEKELKRQKKAEQQENEPEVLELEIQKGCLIKLTGLGESFTRENIKAGLESHGTVVFVDYSIGQTEAIVRFDTAVAASVVEGAPTENDVKVIELNSEKIPVRIIEDEEEEEYWKTIAKSKSQARHKYREKYGNKNQWNKGRYNKKNRGKRQNERETADDDKSEPPVKKMKSEGTSEDNESDTSATKPKTVKNEEKSEEPSPKKSKCEATDEANGLFKKPHSVDGVPVKAD